MHNVIFQFVEKIQLPYKPIVNVVESWKDVGIKPSTISVGQKALFDQMDKLDLKTKL